jgi:RNA polymerase II subunit A small phosphatase-like protein
VVPIEIQYRWHNVYVLKRPGVDAFLKKMGEIYEIVVYTASLSMVGIWTVTASRGRYADMRSQYADPVLDKLDIHHVISHRLFRESCYNHRGTSYVKVIATRSLLSRTVTNARPAGPLAARTASRGHDYP